MEPGHCPELSNHFPALWPVMASSKCFNFERLCDICKCDNRLQSFLRLNKVLFNFHGSCYRCGSGHINLRQDRSAPDGQIWRCSNKKCSVKIPLRKHSFFPDLICLLRKL